MTSADQISSLAASPDALLRFDDFYSLDVTSDYFSQFGTLIAKSKKKAKNKKDLEKLFVQTLKEITGKLFAENRISELEVFLTKDEESYESEDESRKYVLALALGEDWAEPIFRGPPSNTPEGKEFRNDFVDLAEIRKYADNSLCETVEWVKMNKNAHPDESEDFKKSIPQRWLEFIVYKKLMLPEGSLQHIAKAPAHWTSLIPRNQLPPSVVHNAFAKLGKMFREIKEVPLQIVGVNCVSGYYRNTEPIAYVPAPKIVGNAKKLLMKKLSVDSPVPPLQPTVDVYISLERSGKWGKVPVQIAAYKTLYYDVLAKEFAKQYKAVAVPQKDRILIKLDRIIFSVYIVHDEELERHQAENEQPQKLADPFTKHAHLAILTQKLHSIGTKFSAFAESVHLAKRFVAGAQLSNHFDPLVIELLVAYGFLNAAGRNSGNGPLTSLSGFLQFLKTLATFNFVQEPLFVDINENFNEESKQELRELFIKRRPVLPPIVLITPEDKSGIRLMAKKTEPFAAKRLIDLAKEKWNDLKGRLEEGKHVDLSRLCTTNSSIYDLKIQLDQNKATHFPKPVKSTQTRDKISKKCAFVIPVVDFDLSKRLVSEFEKHFGSKLMFFYDEFETEMIYGALRPNFKVPNVDLTLTNCSLRKRTGPKNEVNLQALAEDLQIIGQGIVKSITNAKGIQLAGAKTVKKALKRKADTGFELILFHWRCNKLFEMSAQTTKDPLRDMVITVTFQSIMAGSEPCKSEVRRDATVRDLKFIYQAKSGCPADMVRFTYNGRELSNDDETLEGFGMTTNCSVYVSTRVESGLIERTPPPSPGLFFAADILIPQNVEALSQMASIRDAIKNMTNIPNQSSIDKPPDLAKKGEGLWTPEKQMEHQITRSRMRDLLKRRKKVSARTPENFRDTGSLCSSVGMSPLASEPGTPRNELSKSSSLSDLSNLTPKSTASGTSVVEPMEKPVTEKEAKIFFDPAETARDLIVVHQDLYDPPRNREELAAIKKEVEKRRKTTCGLCRRRLPISQQTAICKCQLTFCERHKNPEDHRCNFDYKLSGRKKLVKDNPKVEGGGARKGKPEG
ncbi:unnamed protein product [Bursaphelenchus xylophilus]|uniref:Nucleolar protein 6 n=1 Tax=Bursaphelenchus xylophilus TaxID=6326 RepID=A0A1I7RWB3_BURXY|nr:unnamed protein product [Bursaphelenchus xylophilus]CAG9095402.1 unnamed protein product [Bursaphelenchus xylophilus]